MDGFLGRYSSYIFAIFRIVCGFLFMLHGTKKLFGLPPTGKPGMPLAGLILVSAIIELIAGLLIMIGFFGSIAAFLASGEMAAAYFMAHQPNGSFPIQNAGETPVLFCFAFLYIASRGSGLWSVDSLMKGSRSAGGG